MVIALLTTYSLGPPTLQVAHLKLSAFGLCPLGAADTRLMQFRDLEFRDLLDL